MAPGTGTFPSLINPEAARLLELVRSPQKDRGFKRKVPGRSQVAVKTNLPAAEPTWQRLPPRLGLPRFFPGLAEVLESHQPKGTAESKVPQALEDDSDDDLHELDIKVMSSTAPLPWRQKLEGSLSDQQWYTRRQMAPRVPALPKWLRQQIDRASETAKRSPKSPTSPVEVSTLAQAEVTEPRTNDQDSEKEEVGLQGQRRGGELFFVPDDEDDQDFEDFQEEFERRRLRLKHVVKLRSPKRNQDEPENGLEGLEPDASEEGRAAISIEVKHVDEQKASLPLGSVFKGGRLENTDKKRNQAFKDIKLRSDKTVRVQRLNHRRKQMYKGQDEEDSSAESDVPRRSSKTASVRKPPETADTAEGQLLLEAFRRYEHNDEGELSMKDVRSCLADIGIHPSLPPEKRAVTEVLQSAQPQENGLDFYVISALVPKIWEAIALAKRQDLEYWFSRSLDENGFYDMQQLRPCLEALGLRIHDEEWMEVERIFMPVCRDKKPQKKTFTKSVTKILFEQKMRKVKGQEKSPVHQSDMSDFEVFQKSFFTVQEHLTRRRRRLERQLCEEHQLTLEQIDEFRSDLVPLDFLFRRFDRHRRKKLTENEVLNLLVACGADSRLLRSDFMPSLVREGRFLATVAARSRGSLRGSLLRSPEHSYTSPAFQTQSSGWKKLQKVARPRASRRSPPHIEIVGGSQGEELNFFEFLYLLKFMRQQSLEVQIEDVKAFFQRIDKDEYGNIQMKEAMRLFPELGLSPRSRVEQLEIKQILNEVDEGGTGHLSWEKFTQVVILCQERLERLVRTDEENFAVMLGFTPERCRELRKVFLDTKNDFNFMEMPELRRAMTMMQKVYTSEELIVLFSNFARNGQMDFRCFTKMMHAIDILRNESHLWQDKRKVRKALTESASLTGRF